MGKSLLYTEDRKRQRNRRRLGVSKNRCLALRGMHGTQICHSSLKYSMHVNYRHLVFAYAGLKVRQENRLYEWIVTPLTEMAMRANGLLSKFKILLEPKEKIENEGRKKAVTRLKCF